MSIKDRLYSVVSGFVFSLSFFLFRYDTRRSAARRGRIQRIMEESVH
ncbi:hypothetical protein RG963_16280 [Methanosarcina sp. Z-7115]|uniref:Uncharacterized protein n=1 Tax=Methanosarcina baikalica TaxID=3073890 RepID=A0ABU2D5Q6_9EURY|nr:hypothetical protein [Methanosarcina sp. Z-7115]MDR7667301.1 hypothetical protein [Methanosarcina sp. Z-7115]